MAITKKEAEKLFDKIYRKAQEESGGKHWQCEFPKSSVLKKKVVDLLMEVVNG